MLTLVPQNTWHRIGSDTLLSTQFHQEPGQLQLQIIEIFGLELGNIKTTQTIDGVQKKGLLQKGLFIPDLQRNIFSIGLASKVGLSSQTLDNKLQLRTISRSWQKTESDGGNSNWYIQQIVHQIWSFNLYPVRNIYRTYHIHCSYSYKCLRQWTCSLFSLRTDLYL